MRLAFLITGILLTFFVNGQDNHDTIKVIAEHFSDWPGGSKIYVSKYKVIKIIKGSLTNDTIMVGYYFYKEYKNSPDTALLTLTTYTGPSKIKDYYVFPEYDARKGIEKVKLSIVDFEYWEGCETGRGDCKSLTLRRSSKSEKCFLIMPCGGTMTAVTLSKSKGITSENVTIQKIDIIHSECPPIFELTNLNDGTYFAYMLACELGGQIEIKLKTENE